MKIKWMRFFLVLTLLAPLELVKAAPEQVNNFSLSPELSQKLVAGDLLVAGLLDRGDDPRQLPLGHRALLDERHQRGELDDQAHAVALAELQQRYEDMIRRLDGTYQLPK